VLRNHVVTLLRSFGNGVRREAAVPNRSGQELPMYVPISVALVLVICLVALALFWIMYRNEKNKRQS